MARVTPTDLRNYIDTDPAIKLEPYIRTATRMTDAIAAKAVNDPIGDELLEEIELNLAAHFYCLRDRRLAEEGKGRTRAKYQGTTGMGFEATDYGCIALQLDITGSLNRQAVEGRILSLGEED